MALQIGGNVFKLDTQTTALLNQLDDSVPPVAGEHSATAYSGDRSSLATGPELPQSAGENTLGISLDASGTIKENRFPHWQPQVPFQSHPTPGHPPGGVMHSPGYPQQHAMNPSYPHSHISTGDAAIHARSQAAPIQNESTSAVFHGAGPASHMRTPSGQYVAPPGANQFHDPYRGLASPPATQHPPGTQHLPGTQHMQTVPQMAHDGRPILFYGIRDCVGKDSLRASWTLKANSLLYLLDLPLF